MIEEKSKWLKNGWKIDGENECMSAWKKRIDI